MTPTLTAGEGNLILIDKIMEKENGKIRALENGYEADTRKVLCLLRKEIGEEAFLEKVGRLGSILQAEILRQGVHEESISKAGADGAGESSSTPHITENVATADAGDNGVPAMRINEESGCASQGWKPSEQYLGELDAFMQELSHESPSSQKYLPGLRTTCERPWLLREALAEMEEVWRSFNRKPQGEGWVLDFNSVKWFRIRKLTVRECFRLMNVKETDIDKLLSTEINKKGEEVQVISNSQLYKCAGNSIVVACMYEMFKNLFYPEVAVKETLTDEGVQLSLF